MDQPDRESIEDLKSLIDLDDGIISTFSAQDLEDNPYQVHDAYEQYASTHISMGDTAEFETNLTNELLNTDHPTKGFLYAPFGYGKTSTAVNIWSNLSEQNVIVVPPHTFSSFSDLIQATYGWMRYVFDSSAPGYVNEVDEIYETYMQQEIDNLEDELSLSGDEVQEVLAEIEDRATIDFNIDPVALADFFDDCTELALEAGFKGLVVFPDELQQYFKGANSRQEAEQSFRDFVFDMQSGARISDRFAFVVSMPDSTKSTLDAQAGDVIQRLQSDNITVNLINVYGAEFPAELWSRYAEEFDFSETRHKLIPESTLDAIGQICSRQDLSAGPRTVIDLFRIALTDYLNHGEKFTPLDLANAFYEGRVRYDQDAKIESAIREGIGSSSVKSTADQNVIKLCGVHPEEGLPTSIAKEMSVAAEYETLQKKLQGPVLTWRTKGYTLSSLDDDNGTFLQQLLRQFWEQFDTDDVNAGYVVTAFAEKVLEEKIFETKRGKLTGWTTTGFDPIEPNVYESVAEGTFNGRYPDRRIKLRVATHETRGILRERDIDIRSGFGTPDAVFDFVIDYSPDASPQIRQLDDDHYLFNLDASKALDQLPQGMQNLQKSMNPNHVSPFLMLGLISFIRDQDLEVDAGQERDIEALTDRLVSESIKHLFDRELTTSAPFNIRRAGQRTIEAVYNHVMERIFPEYTTLKVSTQYRNLLQNYRSFLESLDTASMRQGNVTIEESKQEIVERFNRRQTSAFKKRADRQYSDLLEVEKWEGDRAAVRAKVHPLEAHIVKILEEEETISYDRFQSEAYEAGYREEELEHVIDLLRLRRLGKVENEELSLLEAEVSVDEVKTSVADCQNLYERIASLDNGRAPNNIDDTLDEFAQELQDLTDQDTESLDRIDVEARRIKDRLDSIVEDLYRKYRSDCTKLADDLQSLGRGLIPAHVNDDIKAAVKFVGNLNDIRTKLKTKYNSLKQEIEKTRDDIDTAVSKYDTAGIDSAEALADMVTTTERRLEDFEAREQKLKKKSQSLQEWESLSSKVRNVKNRIQQSADVFEDELDELTQINERIDKINEQLTSDPWNAIHNTNTYRQQVEAIEDSFSSRVRERREAFDKKKERLKETLQRATGSEARGLRRATYDIENPDQSRRNLVGKFQDEYKNQVIEAADTQLRQAEQDVIYADIISVGEISGQEPTDVEDEIRTIQSTVNELRTTLKQLSFNQIGPVEQSTVLNELASKGNRVTERAEEIRKEGRRFLQEQAPEDKELEKLLEKVQEERTVSFKELIMSYHSDPRQEDIDPETLLSRINQLFILNQVDIQVESRSRR